MRKGRFVVIASALWVACLCPQLAYAQATRTWVSGVGDDANPCSRTAPCKTFAGAISKTAPSGEIDALDPGGFGALTITKSITIDGTAGLTGVLVSGTNGLVVAAPAGTVVILRNLDIDGLGTGLDGILITGGGDVVIENCKIYGFANRGIEDDRTSGHLLVSNTTISDNAQTGILALSGGGSSLRVAIDHVRLHGNGNAGLAVTGGALATVEHSSATSNAHGFYADSGATLDLNDSVASANSTSGVIAATGAMIRMANTTVTNNGIGLNMAGGGIFSYGSNRIAGNAAGNGPATAMLPVQ